MTTLAGATAVSVSPPAGQALFDHLAEAGGGTTAVATEVLVLREPALAWQQRIDLIDHARSSLAATVYCIEGNETGVAFLSRLVAAAERGVNVCLCVDWVAQRAMGGEGGSAYKAKLAELFAALGAAGGVVSYYATPADHLLRNLGQGQHFKSLVADGEVAIVGGRNIGDHYYKHWRDFEFLLRGPIVTEIANATTRILLCSNPNAGAPAISTPVVQQRHHELAVQAFLDDVRAAAPRLRQEAQAKQERGPLPRFHFIFHDPTNSAAQSNPITDTLVAAFDATKRRALATSNYVNPAERVLSAMTRAAQRGAEVLAVYTSEEGSTISTLPYFNALHSARVLLGCGATVSEVPVQEHGKMFLFDDVAAAGSYNLEFAADEKLSECLLLTDDPIVVANIHEAIRQSAATGAPVREKKRGFLGGLAAAVKAQVAWWLRRLM